MPEDNAEAVKKAPRPREKIPGYLFGEVIGTGAYAKVRRCYSEKHNCHVAIKIVSKEKAPKDYLTKFLPREIKTIGNLSHENIIRVKEVLETNGNVYIVMEEAEKGDLLDYINSHHRKIPERDAKNFFYQILLAVEYCHKHNVVHRDLKCENILFDRDMKIKLSDFGFARFVNPDNTPLKTHCGSLAYAAPEIVKGKDYDGKIADVWSMGVILYAMVNGKLPFNDSSVKNLLTAIYQGINFQPNVSDACKDVIKQMLTIDVNKRSKIKDLLNHPWFESDITSPRTSDTATPRDVLVARNEKGFIKTPKISPSASPAVSPRQSRDAVHLAP